MARKLRIEYAGAHYHVINRGNYRDWIFETEGARMSFLECLREVWVASARMVPQIRKGFQESDFG